MKTLSFNDTWGDNVTVELYISSYANNKSLYIGLESVKEDYSEPYGDVTVNLNGKPLSYCAYVDTGNMPELEAFIAENKLGSDTGLKQRSGYNEYPLYMFDVEKLRELCPDGLAEYEKANGIGKKPETKEKAK